MKMTNGDDAKKDLAQRIEMASKGLFYISETDAEILPFVGMKSAAVTKEEILRQTEKKADTPVEERDFDEIFQRLSKIEDWFGDEEKETAEKYVALRTLLKKTLKDLKVFKVGSIELNVYFVGLDAEGNLMGIKTRAVET